MKTVKNENRIISLSNYLGLPDWVTIKTDQSRPVKEPSPNSTVIVEDTHLLYNQDNHDTELKKHGKMFDKIILLRHNSRYQINTVAMGTDAFRITHDIMQKFGFVSPGEGSAAK